MPRTNVPKSTLSRQQVIERLGVYPPNAFEFVERGLSQTVQNIQRASGEAGETRHVTGQELCWGLRNYAAAQWGLLARTVLMKWNITDTMDFGRIVYALIDGGLMQKQDDDSIEHFRNVYDFKTAFDGEYKMECD